MSVINTMLKDLQKRESSYADNNAILQGLKSRTSPPAAAAPRTNLWLITALGAGFIIALLAVTYFISPYQLVKASAPTEKPSTSTNPAASQPAPVSTTPVAVEELPVAQQTTVMPIIETVPTVTPVPTTPVTKPAATATIASQTARVITPTEPAVKQQPTVTTATTLSTETEITTAPRQSKTPVVLSAEEMSQQTYSAALTQYNQGQTQPAKYLLKEALVTDPKNKSARHLLAAIHLVEQRPDIAIDVLEQGLALNLQDMDLLRIYLQALVQTENYTKAISTMETYFQLTAPDDMAYLAGLYQKNKQHLPALKYYSQALRLIPGNSIWWMGQGISLEALEQNQQAQDSYQQALSTGRLTTQLNEFVKQRITSLQTKPGSTP
jgi:MSHA biogenesis protein MshN